MAEKHPKVPIARTIRSLRKKVDTWQKAGKTVALVPTMGALHEGHLSLVKLARKKADRIVVSIFVNPTQFGAGEDFNTYPRTQQTDHEKLARLKTDLIYTPKSQEMYPHGFSTNIHVEGLTDTLCGTSRPDLFDGVATIVTKLLLQVTPNIAIFGEKDYQQLLVIKQLTQDLNIPVKIVGGAIVREKDGLAMSSRNEYLSPSQRITAPLLQKTMKEIVSELKSGKQRKAVLTRAKKSLQKAGFRIDYLEVRNSKTLELITINSTAPARIFAAVFLGRTRLIDNIRI